MDGSTTKAPMMKNTITMTRNQAEKVLGLLDKAMVKMTNSNVSQEAFDYLQQAMTIVEREFYSTEHYGSDVDPRQQELDFNEPDYRKLSDYAFGEEDG